MFGVHQQDHEILVPACHQRAGQPLGHAARLGSIRLVVTRPSETFVRLGVVDRSRNIPYLRTDSGGDNTRGRGLLLVDALTDRWGTDRCVVPAPPVLAVRLRLANTPAP
ncbi:hypothetical protein GCM10010390_04660 [Streptomyces mordarskii]|uniref:Regulatory protein n=1 Tax=Streptomyces mordarskii TaxID=1226758 RepID=A0ABP3LSM7_9ACTN